MSALATRLVREAIGGVVPEPVWPRRKKVGYNAPIAHWLGHGLQDWLWDAIHDQKFLRNELWNGALVAIVRTKRDTHQPWTTLEPQVFCLRRPRTGGRPGGCGQFLHNSRRFAVKLKWTINLIALPPT